MYDNEFKTKGNKIWTKDKIEPQHIVAPLSVCMCYNQVKLKIQ